MDFPPFPGFRAEALAFLRDLAANNEREWFKARKNVFDDEVKWPLQCLVAEVGREAANRNIPLKGDPKNGLFRIYRDTRFSKNKVPYKTHAGAVLTRSGSRKEAGVVYIHVQPSASFVAAGYYRPDNTFLRAWRQRMADDPESFLGILAHLDTAGLTLEHIDSLKRIPRDYRDFADTPIADWLRWKSFITSYPITDDALQEPAFAQTVTQVMQDTLPLLQYGWEIEDSLHASDG